MISSAKYRILEQQTLYQTYQINMQINYHEVIPYKQLSPLSNNFKSTALKIDDIPQSKTMNSDFCNKYQSNSTFTELIKNSNLLLTAEKLPKKPGRFTCNPKQNIPLFALKKNFNRFETQLNSSNGGSLFANFNDTKNGHLDEILGLNDTELANNLKKVQQSKDGKVFDNIFKVSLTKRFNALCNISQKQTSNLPTKNKIVQQSRQKQNTKREKKKEQIKKKYRNKFIKNENPMQVNMNINQNKTTSMNINMNMNMKLKSQSKLHRSANNSICGQEKQRCWKDLMKDEDDHIYSVGRNNKQGYFQPKSYVQIQNYVKLKKLSSISKVKKQNNKMLNKQLDVHKYLKNNFTRYNINQLQSLHRAILQYSKGQISLLKKSLVVVLNMSGILIEEEKLDQMGVTLDNKRKSNVISRSNLKKNFTMAGETKKGKEMLRSFRNIISGKTIGDFNKASKQRVSKVLQQNLKNISNFDCFLQLYKTIEIYYFKQSIIDYLQILLGGIQYENSQKKKPKLRRKMQTQITMMLNERDISSQSEQQEDIKQVEIGYDDLYDAFRKRNSQEQTLKIVDFIQIRIKQHYKQNLRSVYQKPKRTQKKVKQRESGVEEDWRITLKQLFNLCYYDNQLCQMIHQFYVKQTNKGKTK